MKLTDMNAVIANNINKYLEENNRKQVELAEYLNVSRQIVSKMLNGARTINAAELQKIAEFCDRSMEDLTLIPQQYEEQSMFHVFMGKVKTEEAERSIQDIDTLIELILFHVQVNQNGTAMREEWTDF